MIVPVTTFALPGPPPPFESLPPVPPVPPRILIVSEVTPAGTTYVFVDPVYPAVNTAALAGLGTAICTT